MTGMLSDIVRVGRRFRRSVRIDADVAERGALDGYVCPQSAVALLRNMAEQAGTGQGAFTWTGPYGCGKSSLAVLLAALLGADADAAERARKIVGARNANWLQARLGAGRLVVPVVGRRAPPEADVLAAVGAALPGVAATEAVAALVEASRTADGVLLVVDEMGKYLEHAARGGDIHFFQQVAEAAARSEGRILVVGVLHQSFDDYAGTMARAERGEWMKVQGRFSDLPFNGGVDEQVGVIARAVESDAKPRESAAAVALARAVQPSSESEMASALSACWPLSPAVAYLVGPMSRRRFGQGQRSVFGFLTSGEPYGFQSFLSETAADSGVEYGLPRLWDYLRANLEPAILASPDGRRWSLAVDALERCEARGGGADHAGVLKAAALIEMFRDRTGLAVSRAVVAACSGVPDVDSVLSDLVAWSVLVFRRHAGAYGVFAGSDFDIDAAVAEAKAASTGLDLAAVAGLAALQPVLAKRFYHRTGAMMWFEVALVRSEGAVAEIRGRSPARGAAGVFALLVPGGVDEAGDARGLAAECAAAVVSHPVAVGVDDGALALVDAAAELQALAAVRASRMELAGDEVARREIDARIAVATGFLAGRVEESLARAWWAANVADGQVGGGAIAVAASRLAEAFYDRMPVVLNEMSNRLKPSSSAVAAQRALMRALLANADQPRLGMVGYPAEYGLYVALVEGQGLHVADPDVPEAMRLVGPREGDAGRLHGLWQAADAVLAAPGATAVAMSEIFDAWRAAPYGLRDGLMAVYGLAYVLTRESGLSVYLDGVFQVGVGDFLVDRLMQDAASVRIRRTELSGVQALALAGVADAVEAHGGFGCSTGRTPLDVAKGLVRIVQALPSWAIRTGTLPREAARLRDAARAASDPNRLLFDDLPRIADGGDSAAVVTAALDAVVAAYPAMLSGFEGVMLRELRVAERTPEALSELRRRAENVRGLTGDFRLDALASRLADYGYVADGLESVEGVASLVAGKPSRDWVDRDADRARMEVAALAAGFVRAEALAHVKGRSDGRVGFAIYTSELSDAPPVREEFVVSSSDLGRVDSVVAEIRAILEREGLDRELALATAARLGASVSGEWPAPQARSERKARKIA